VHLVLNCLPVHKRVPDVPLPAGLCADLNPDELGWSHVKRTGVARRPLRKGEKLCDKIVAQQPYRRCRKSFRSLYYQPLSNYNTLCVDGPPTTGSTE